MAHWHHKYLLGLALWSCGNSSPVAVRPSNGEEQLASENEVNSGVQVDEGAGDDLTDGLGDSGGGSGSGSIAGGSSLGSNDNSENSATLRFVILEPGSAQVGIPKPIIIQVLDALNQVSTDRSEDVTLVCTGSTAGCGIVNIEGGEGSLNIANAVPESVSLSLLDSANSGFDVSSTRNLTFSLVSNLAPELAAIADQTVSENVAIAAIDGNDAGDDFDVEGNPINYSCYFDQILDGSVAASSPCSGITGLVFIAGTGSISWTPSYSQSGIYEFRLEGSDGSLSDSVVVCRTINGCFSLHPQYVPAT